MSMQYRLMIILILSFWPSRNDCQEIYTGFGFGFGPSFPAINQAEWYVEGWNAKGLKHGHTSFNLVRTQMGPVINSEFFVGYGPFELSLHSSFFRMSQREVKDTEEYHYFDSGGWLNSFLVELRYKVSPKLFRPYLNVGIGAFHFRPKDSQNLSPKLHFGGVSGLGSEFAFLQKRGIYFFTELRFQIVAMAKRHEDIFSEITGTLDIIAGCRFWISSE